MVSLTNLAIVLGGLNKNNFFDFNQISKSACDDLDTLIESVSEILSKTTQIPFDYDPNSRVMRILLDAEPTYSDEMFAVSNWYMGDIEAQLEDAGYVNNDENIQRFLNANGTRKFLDLLAGAGNEILNEMFTNIPEMEREWTVYLENVDGNTLDQTVVVADTESKALELGNKVFRESNWVDGYPTGFEPKAYV